MSEHLDPNTLRTLARRLDDRTDSFRRQCRCAIHLALIGLADELAADYRTEALRVEQSTKDGAT